MVSYCGHTSLAAAAAAAAANVLLLRVAAAAAPSCPAGATELGRFREGGDESWLACEDLSRPDGTISLVNQASLLLLLLLPSSFFLLPSSFFLLPSSLSRPDGTISLVNQASADVVWLPKTHAPYTQGTDGDYYLGLGKQHVLNGSKS
eukprot:SAG31_NODE_19479_length_600_cov_1.473054_1_plen_147_part_10